jgi:hypothetical protein
VFADSSRDKEEEEEFCDIKRMEEQLMQLDERERDEE